MAKAIFRGGPLDGIEREIEVPPLDFIERETRYFLGLIDKKQVHYYYVPAHGPDARRVAPLKR